MALFEGEPNFCCRMNPNVGLFFGVGVDP